MPRGTKPMVDISDVLQEEFDRRYRAGCDKYFEKPVVKSKFLKCINRKLKMSIEEIESTE